MTRTYLRSLTTATSFLFLPFLSLPAQAALKIPVENSLGYTVYLWLYSYPHDEWYQRVHLSHQDPRRIAEVQFDDGLQYVLAKDLDNRETYFGRFDIDSIKHEVELSRQPSHLRLKTVLVSETRTQCYATTKMVPEERTKVITVTKWRREQRTRTVRIWNQRSQSYETCPRVYYVLVPHEEQVEVKYTICKPCYEQKTREYTVQVPRPALQLVVGDTVKTLPSIPDSTQ